jgi:protease-4
VIRIDSPGGAVGPSQEIFREIRKTSKSKKVVASMGSIAASGGYYVAAGTDGIVANPGTITGSIGVIMGFTNYQQLLSKIGLVPIVIKSGKYKDMGSPVRKMKPEEKKILKNFARKIHRQFIRDIVEGRKMDKAKVWAGRLGGIKGKISTVYARDKKFSLINYIMDSSAKALLNRITDPSLSADYLYAPEKTVNPEPRSNNQ